MVLLLRRPHVKHGAFSFLAVPVKLRTVNSKKSFPKFWLAIASAVLALAASKSYSASPGTPLSRVVTKVVGEAKDQFITSREVQINDAVETVLAGKGQGKSLQIVEIGHENFPAKVTDVLTEWIVYFEAQSFSADAVSKATIEEATQKVEKGTAGSVAFKRLDVSKLELEEMLKRKLSAKAFIRLKTESSLMPVTDAEAQTYFKKNRIKFGNLPFSAFKDSIKAHLRQQQMDRRMKDWLDILQKKYKVRNFVAG